jgi:RNA polymerase sigma-70 factor (ECF subfamily)
MYTRIRPRRHVLGVVVIGSVMPVESLAALREAEFAVAVEVEGRRLYALALGLLGDRHDAEDAVQETMEQAWRRWDSLRDADRRGAWLAAICVRTSSRLGRRLRARWRHGELSDEHGATPPDRGDALDLLRACRGLSMRQRSVVVLHYVYGFTLDECAEVMGCSAGTVRPHLRRALEKLRESYGQA